MAAQRCTSSLTPTDSISHPDVVGGLEPITRLLPPIETDPLKEWMKKLSISNSSGLNEASSSVPSLKMRLYPLSRTFGPVVASFGVDTTWVPSSSAKVYHVETSAFSLA